MQYMPKSIINTTDASLADVLIVSAPYDLTASFHKGTAEGPKKVIECLNTQIEFWDKRYKIESTEHIAIAHTEIAGLTTMTPEEAHKAVVKTCTESAAPLTFLLGGEHSMSYGALSALAEKHNPKDVTAQSEPVGSPQRIVDDGRRHGCGLRRHLRQPDSNCSECKIKAWIIL